MIKEIEKFLLEFYLTNHEEIEHEVVGYTIYAILSLNTILLNNYIFNSIFFDPTTNRVCITYDINKNRLFYIGNLNQDDLVLLYNAITNQYRRGILNF